MSKFVEANEKIAEKVGEFVLTGLVAKEAKILHILDCYKVVYGTVV